MSANPGGPFEIGLVMAGAVSGGAYTAGVLDFFVEAVDAWYAAMAQDPDNTPRHSVLLKAMSGASAGSMSAAILATALGFKFPHVRLDPHGPAPQATGNPLYDSWVRSVDIRDLLDVSDLDRTPATAHRLLSLLNSETIEATVNTVLGMAGPAAPRPWVAGNLPVLLAVGNLRGVPYGIPLRGAGIVAHAMMRHGDHVSFAVNGAGSGPPTSLTPEFVTLSRPNGAVQWKSFGDAAMASGAFPFALRPRLLARNGADYLHRTYLEAGDCKPTVSAYKTVAPAWAVPPPDYRFLCMDGGVMNNEPLELVRALLTNLIFERNPRHPAKAHRATVLLDPFVDPHEHGPDDERPLHELLAPLFGAWKAQCRFKPEDLALAYDDDVHSRFVIAPSRSYGPQDGAHPLAAGGLGAFLGFFCEAFRRHDYQLGRRNCQRFLRVHFTLAKENPLFDTWPAAVKAAWLLKPEYAGKELPIVPLVGACDTVEEDHLCWPAGACDPATLKKPIKKRIAEVYDALKDDLDLGFFARAWLAPAWWAGKGTLVKTAIAKITAALAQQKLDKEP